jgi:hypothetical protein
MLFICTCTRSIPGYNGEQAILYAKYRVAIGWYKYRSVDLPANVVYVTGTYDSVLNGILYALPILFHNKSATTTK